MFPTKQPYQFKDNITVEFLQKTCTDHQQIAEELALSEIHSIELVMPKFNTMATLNKFEFNKLMSNIKRKFKDTHTFTVMVAAISDTFTCMLQNSKFYDNFIDDNKHGLELLMDLLQTIKLLLVTYRRAVETKQLETLIDILEKSAERIQNYKEHYKIMQQIISSLRTCTQNLLFDKENDVDTKIESAKNVIQDKIKFPILPTNNNIVYNNKKTSNTSIKTEDKCLGNKSVQQSSHVAALNSQIDNNKRPANAFELMMTSSKKLAVKRKCPM